MRGGTIVAVGDEPTCARTATHAPTSWTRAATRSSPAWSIRPAPLLGRGAGARDGSQRLPHGEAVLEALAAGAAPRLAVRLGAGLRRGADAAGDRRGGARRRRVRAVSDLHTALASPRALQLAHVTGPHAFGDGSEVVCVDGVPTGELRESGAQDLVLRAAPRLRWPELRARHVEQLQRLNALGLTGAHVMDGEPATHDLLRDLEGADELTMRLRVPQWLTPDMIDAELETRLALRDERGRLWCGGTAKFFADGVIDAGTAWLEAPDTHGEGTAAVLARPGADGQVMERFAAAGFQLATHTIGDAAVRFTLATYLRARQRHAPPARAPRDAPRRPRRRDRRRGVTASMQPVHLAAVKPDGNWSERLGPERAARAFRMRDLLDAGAVLALGSDWPVANADPRLGLAAARERDVLPEQALTAHEALAGYTLAPAHAVGEEGVAGRIRVGMRADLTGLAADPVDAPASDLPDNPVWLTVVAGRVVHQEEVGRERQRLRIAPGPHSAPGCTSDIQRSTSRGLRRTTGSAAKRRGNSRRRWCCCVSA